MHCHILPLESIVKYIQDLLFISCDLYEQQRGLVSCSSYSLLLLSLISSINISFIVDEYKTIITPPFAESISEGDIKWEKGMYKEPIINLINVIRHINLV